MSWDHQERTIQESRKAIDGDEDEVVLCLFWMMMRNSKQFP